MIDFKKGVSAVIRVFPAWFGLFLISGCGTVPKSPVYRSYTLEQFSPKPASYVVPILLDRPNRKFEFIGRLSCVASQDSSDENDSDHSGIPSRSELMRMAQDKARRVGADAILLVENAEDTEQSGREINKVTQEVMECSVAFDFELLVYK